MVEGGVESLVSAFTRCSNLTLVQYQELQKSALAAASLYSFSVHASAQLGVYGALRTSRGSTSSDHPDRRTVVREEFGSD